MSNQGSLSHQLIQTSMLKVSLRGCRFRSLCETCLWQFLYDIKTKVASVVDSAHDTTDQSSNAPGYDGLSLCRRDLKNTKKLKSLQNLPS